MYIAGPDGYTHLMIKPESDLDNIKPEFLENKYIVRLSGKFDDIFIEKFIKIFKHTTRLDIGNQYGSANNSFIYEMPNLEALGISLFTDSDFILDCAKLPKPLKELNISVWSKKHIVNIEALNDTKLEHLYISDFNEKDLTKLSCLTNLKLLDLTRAKIKSLKGIETLTKIRVLVFGATQSLSDITDIVALKDTLKYVHFILCSKMRDFSPIGKLTELEILEITDCKYMESIGFIREMPDLQQLDLIGNTLINDLDTTPAKHVPAFYGSRYKNYNKEYPEKELKEGMRTLLDIYKEYISEEGGLKPN